MNPIVATALAYLLFVPAASAELPPLIPREVLFAPDERSDPQVSPDGRWLSFIAPDSNGVQNVFLRRVGEREERQLTRDGKRGIFDYLWSPEGSHVLYVQDRDGDENWHVYATDIATGATRDLTLYEGVRAEPPRMDPRHPGVVMVPMNRRDPRVFDMYRVDLATGVASLEAENPGDVVEWVADDNFVLRAAAAIDDDANAIIRVRDSATAPWRELLRWNFEEAGFDRFQRIVGFSSGGRGLRVQTCVGSNTTRIVEIDLATGAMKDIVPADPDYDLWNPLSFTHPYFPVAVMRHPSTGAIQAYAVHSMLPEWRALDPAIAADFERIRAFRPGLFEIESRDAEDRHWIVEIHSDTDPGAYYLYDRESRAFELLFRRHPEFDAYTFAPMRAVRYPARDGRTIHAFLTLPAGVPARNLPLVVLPHGGPWARDEWGFNGEVQWLANRGYGVIQPQFRGSTGFGNAFLAASTGEIGPGAMQHDLSDAVAWAVREGIADPKRVAIMGASYGGYATLSGLAFTPDLYACGVDIVGPSSMKTLIESFPPYWAPRLKRWIARVGNVIEDDALNRRISPLYHVERMRAPLLIGHGANDPRVKIAESNQVVEALRKNGTEVTYVVYPDEGHGFGRHQNVDDFNGRVEAFLAKHLGGRAEPARKIEGSTAELR
jgi:dipeptidyl aminopeptidase/acylaminoacyl peptidase